MILHDNINPTGKHKIVASHDIQIRITVDDRRQIMDERNGLQFFEDKMIRTVWDEEKEKWYFSVVDVVAVLTDSPNPNNYWKVLKNG